MKQLNLNHRTRLTENARFWRTVINKKKGKRKGKGKGKEREKGRNKNGFTPSLPQEIGNFHGHAAASG